VDREISPVAMWGTVAVVLLVVIVAGFIYSGRNTGKLTPEQERQAQQTIQQQYQGYFGPNGGGPIRH
jgi:Na+-transporting NADH:ubiquinone oxidoreductase subunit NqrC